jgi:predicted TIM-barrel enzyme
MNGPGNHDPAADPTEDIMEKSWNEREEVICLIHGGPFYDPDSTRIIYEKTDAQGFVGASSVERIPIEIGVVNICQGFKDAAHIRSGG